MHDPHDLQRFVDAQRPVYGQVLAELRAGRKTSHWMWFIFPQLKALGRSGTARHFGIASRAEALAYARHPLLGERLVECSELVCAVPRSTVHQIFGSPDDLKFRSCMTLFDAVAPQQPVFALALRQYFGAQPDERTLELLAAQDRSTEGGGPTA